MKPWSPDFFFLEELVGIQQPASPRVLAGAVAVPGVAGWPPGPSAEPRGRARGECDSMSSIRPNLGIGALARKVLVCLFFFLRNP